MNEREELKIALEQELQWVQYRQNMLNNMEEKLIQMKKLSEWAKQGNLTAGEIEAVNVQLNNLASQVRALDGESRRMEDGKILE